MHVMVNKDISTHWYSNIRRRIQSPISFCWTAHSNTTRKKPIGQALRRFQEQQIQGAINFKFFAISSSKKSSFRYSLFPLLNPFCQSVVYRYRSGYLRTKQLEQSDINRIVLAVGAITIVNRIEDPNYGYRMWVIPHPEDRRRVNYFFCGRPSSIELYSQFSTFCIPPSSQNEKLLNIVDDDCNLYRLHLCCSWVLICHLPPVAALRR